MKTPEQIKAEISQEFVRRFMPRVQELPGEQTLFLNSVIAKVISSIRSEMPERYVHKDNPTHDKDEYWGCCECYEDDQKNKVREKMLEVLSKWEQIT